MFRRKFTDGNRCDFFQKKIIRCIQILKERFFLLMLSTDKFHLVEYVDFFSFAEQD